jgi:hypothetical protein
MAEREAYEAPESASTTMPQREAYQAPEHGTERWKSALAKRATHLEEEYDEEGDDFDFLCPGDVIQYRLHPNPTWFTDTIVSTDPDRAPFRSTA